MILTNHGMLSDEEHGNIRDQQGSSSDQLEMKIMTREIDARTDVALTGVLDYRQTH